MKECENVERALQLAFGNTRINPKREFFKSMKRSIKGDITDFCAFQHLQYQ